MRLDNLLHCIKVHFLFFAFTACSDGLFLVHELERDTCLVLLSGPCSPFAVLDLINLQNVLHALGLSWGMLDFFLLDSLLRVCNFRYVVEQRTIQVPVFDV